MRRLLLIEDDHRLGEIVMATLADDGYDVIWAKTVAQARACYSPDRFDVILTDYELPDGTGVEFLQGIRGSDKATTILWSGLDRGRELAAAGVEVDILTTKTQLPEVFDAIRAVRP